MRSRPRSRSRALRFAAACTALAVLPFVFAWSTRAMAAEPVSASGPGGSWLRPVDGPVRRPFVAPISRYGPGHRGADLAAPPGTPVRAANDGIVTFAGDVAGSRHVVVAHSGGLRTSYSFLLTVAVRAGARVRRGEVLGTAGGTGPEHGVGVLHLGLRVGDRYVDPMVLFAPVDLTRLIRLVPVDAPVQRGLDPPPLERRELAAALHLPQGIPGTERGDSGGSPLAGLVGEAADALDPLGDAASWVWHRTLLAPLASDAREVGARLVRWARSRGDCTSDTAAPAGGGGSGHLLMAVAGIDSATDARTGATFALDTNALGYRDGEVRYFSYSPTGGAYERADTWRDLHLAALALGAQLRAMQRDQPGREVDLVAHSQGGVVVREYLEHVYRASDPTLPPVGTVVTLASPHEGAPLATAAADIGSTPVGRAALDMAQSAAAGAIPPTDARAVHQLDERAGFMGRLHRGRLPDQVDLTSVSGVDDVVVPADHTEVAGTGSVTVNPAGPSDHAAILRDPRGLAATRLALEGRPLPCVSWTDGLRGAVEPVFISRIEHTAGSVGRAAGRAIGPFPTPGGIR